MEERILETRNLRKWFPVRRGLLESLFSKRQAYLRAVDGISFNVGKKEGFGFVGESGCGKTTTAALVCRLIEPTSGQVCFRGADITSLEGSNLKKLRRKMQIVFQDPYDSLSERLTIRNIVAEPLRIHGIADNVEEKVAQMLLDVGLTPPEGFMERYPHELSGGQRQRVSIARALMLQPELLVADEPVSMIDVSLRASILNLLISLKDKYSLTCIFITHDINIARYMCDRIAVMYLGKIVEVGYADTVIHESKHPYTKALMSVVPVADPTLKRHRMILSEVPNSIYLPSGCRFHPRCPYAKEVCRVKEPEIEDVDRDHYAACHFIGELQE